MKTPTKTAEKIVSKLIDEFIRVRKEKGLSHERLAALAGLSRTAISFIENRKRVPSIVNCIKIADALEISLGDFFK